MNRFFRNQHLRLSRDFKRLSEDYAHKVVTEFFVLKISPNELPFSRIGIITSKRVGCAVERNWARRVIREVFRTDIQSRYGTYDLLVIIRPRILHARFSAIRENFRTAIEQYVSDDDHGTAKNNTHNH